MVAVLTTAGLTVNGTYFAISSLEPNALASGIYVLKSLLRTPEASAYGSK